MICITRNINHDQGVKLDYDIYDIHSSIHMIWIKINHDQGCICPASTSRLPIGHPCLLPGHDQGCRLGLHVAHLHIYQINTSGIHIRTPLPGHDSRSGVQAGVAHLSNKYEWHTQPFFILTSFVYSLYYILCSISSSCCRFIGSRALVLDSRLVPAC